MQLLQHGILIFAFFPLHIKVVHLLYIILHSIARIIIANNI